MSELSKMIRDVLFEEFVEPFLNKVALYFFEIKKGLEEVDMPPYKNPEEFFNNLERAIRVMEGKDNRWEKEVRILKKKFSEKKLNEWYEKKEREIEYFMGEEGIRDTDKERLRRIISVYFMKKTDPFLEGLSAIKRMYEIPHTK